MRQARTDYSSVVLRASIGAPLGVDASPLVEGMQRLEDGQGDGHAKP